MQSQKTLYSNDWFRVQKGSASQSAEIIVPMITDLINPRSVVDVGCGVGAWLATFHRRGVESVFGIDGDYIDRTQLQIPAESFHAQDLAMPIEVERTFDLAVCLEVAEHLPPGSSRTLVKSLTSLAPVILFSAAIPGQGGTGHVNCAWPDYWGALFCELGYVPIDCIRRKLWMNEQVWWWYAQNIFILAKESDLSNYPELLRIHEVDPAMPMRLVHPTLFGSLVYSSNPETAPLVYTWNLFRRTLSSALRRRIARATRARQG
jgi:SAM-dependent methyltransferase